jgi:hypothetical protein
MRINMAAICCFEIFASVVTQVKLKRLIHRELAQEQSVTTDEIINILLSQQCGDWDDSVMIYK